MVEPTHLKKNAPQIGSFPQVGVTIKTIWNHHLVNPLKNIQKSVKHPLEGDQKVIEKSPKNEEPFWGNDFETATHKTVSLS